MPFCLLYSKNGKPSDIVVLCIIFLRKRLFETPKTPWLAGLWILTICFLIQNVSLVFLDHLYDILLLVVLYGMMLLFWSIIISLGKIFLLVMMLLVIVCCMILLLSYYKGEVIHDFLMMLSIE